MEIEIILLGSFLSLLTILNIINIILSSNQRKSLFKITSDHGKMLETKLDLLVKNEEKNNSKLDTKFSELLLKSSEILETMTQSQNESLKFYNDVKNINKDLGTQFSNVISKNSELLRSISQFQIKTLEFYEYVKKDTNQLIDIVEEVTRLDTLDD